MQKIRKFDRTHATHNLHFEYLRESGRHHSRRDEVSDFND